MQKKIKPKIKTVPSLADIDVDFEFPSTSTADEIPSQECYIANQLNELQINQSDNEEIETAHSTEDIPVASQVSSAPVEDFNDELTLRTEPASIDVEASATCIEPIAGPSAPLIESIALPKLSQLHHQPKVQYPNLQMVHDEIASACVQSPRSRVIPFTLAQLNALYSNPEIERAQSFEREFVHNELQTNSNKHVLFELLTKYSRCRQALRINCLDVQTIRKDLENSCGNGKRRLLSTRRRVLTVWLIMPASPTSKFYEQMCFNIK